MGACNVGVLLGSASGGLVDVDLDCQEALVLAPYYLPTTWVFGRATKPCSHWLYVCAGARTHKLSGADDKTMLEVRSDASDGPGLQTVMPPSVHVSGEAIEWDPEHGDGLDGPRELSEEQLLSCVAKLARGVLFMQAGASADEARAQVARHRPARLAPATSRRPHVSSTNLDVTERARKYLAKMDASIEGNFGHTALFRAAVKLVKSFGLDEATAVELLETEFNPRCQPAWPRKELERKVRQAVEKSHAVTGSLVSSERRRA